MMINSVLLLIILTTGMFYAIITRKLTTSAASVGGLLCLVVYTATGFTGILMIITFFLLGSSATSFKQNIKEEYGIEERNSGRRTYYQVLANIGMAGILSLLIIMFPERSFLLQGMLSASLSSATADTLSSELGNVYGRNFYNIINLKRDERGLDGVISIEGCLFGIMGSSIIALIYGLSQKFDSFFFLIIVSGTMGNLIDSVLGAVFQRKGYLTNDVVNFLNTLTAAIAFFVFAIVI